MFSTRSPAGSREASIKFSKKFSLKYLFRNKTSILHDCDFDLQDEVCDRVEIYPYIILSSKLRLTVI